MFLQQYSSEIVSGITTGGLFCLWTAKRVLRKAEEHRRPERVEYILAPPLIILLGQLSGVFVDVLRASFHW